MYEEYSVSNAREYVTLVFTASTQMSSTTTDGQHPLLLHTIARATEKSVRAIQSLFDSGEEENRAQY
jgi:hypothetical protein